MPAILKGQKRRSAGREARAAVLEWESFFVWSREFRRLESSFRA